MDENEIEKDAEESSEEVVEQLNEEVGELKEKDEEGDVDSKQFPANKYELAIVAAQEARRMNEAWKDQEGKPAGRVTDIALDRVKKGRVRYSVGDDSRR